MSYRPEFLHARARALLFMLPAFMFGAYPLAVVASANAGTLPLDGLVIARSILVECAALMFIVWLLRPVQPDLQARAMWVNSVVLILIFYESAVLQARRWGFITAADDPIFAAVYGVAALALGTVVSRPWKTYSRNAIPLNLFAGALLCITIYPVAVAATEIGTPAWRQPADRLIESALSSPAQTPVTPRHDIYYLVLDGMGRPDTLKELYDTDLSPFVASLKDKGFYVADRAQSNYGQTFFSLASTLNMNYLDDVAATLRHSRDRRPLAYLIQENALMKAARRAGYRVIGITSDYFATERWDTADVCVCARYGLDEVEQSAIAKTPLAAISFDRFTYGAHRRKVIESFAAMNPPSAHDRPTFVFAHIIVPHPPFVFGPNGEPRRAPGDRAFNFGDGDHFLGSKREYVEGYRDQVNFVTGEISTLIDSLLNRPGASPVIVIHGDHGPGSMLSWNSSERTNMRERMGILAAYYFPEYSAALYPAISPVNGARALASRYLGLAHAPLADKSFFSTWNEPYDLIPVENTPETHPPESIDDKRHGTSGR